METESAHRSLVNRRLTSHANSEVTFVKNGNDYVAYYHGERYKVSFRGEPGAPEKALVEPENDIIRESVEKADIVCEEVMGVYERHDMEVDFIKGFGSPLRELDTMQERVTNLEGEVGNLKGELAVLMEERQLRSCKATVDEMCVIFKFEFFTRYKNHVRADVVGNDIVPSLNELADQLDAKGTLSERQEKETRLIRDFMSLSNAPSVDDVEELISLLDSAPRMERNANVHKYPPVFVNYFTGVDKTIPRTREFRGKEQSIHHDCVALREYLRRNPGNGLDEDLVRFGKQAEIFRKGSIKALNTRDYTALPAWD